MKKNILATIVVLLTACGGAGSSGPSIPVIPTPEVWSLKTINLGGTIQSYSNACGSYDIVAKGDFNNDGHEDFVLGPKAKYTPTTGCSDPGFTKLIIAYYDPVTKTFKEDAVTQLVMAEMQWSQSVVVGDFNNDSFLDIFAVGTGTDYGQPCGEAPVLMLGSSKGFINMSHLLPRFSMYSHQAVWADFNNDGKTDFAIFNNDSVPPADSVKAAECSYQRYPGTNDSFIVLSSGDTWKYSTLTVKDRNNNVFVDGRQGFNSATAGDINGDGNADIIVVGNNWGSIAQKTLTLMGNGQGGFVVDSVFVETPYGADTVSANVSLRQLDSSGPLELLVNYAQHPGSAATAFQNSLYKIFSFNTLTSTWSETTPRFITNKSGITETDLTYCARLYWVDINADGREDFVCSAINSFKTDDIAATSPRIWLRTADNRFEPAYHTGFSIAGLMSSPTPVKIDGKIKLVGLTNANFGKKIQINIIE